MVNKQKVGTLSKKRQILRGYYKDLYALTRLSIFRTIPRLTTIQSLNKEILESKKSLYKLTKNSIYR